VGSGAQFRAVTVWAEIIDEVVRGAALSGETEAAFAFLAG
jgi:hypothetical protein